MSVQSDAEEVVRSLAGCDLEGLRVRWRGLYGPPPSLRSVDLLRQILAWRIQADQLGGLDAATRRALRGTAKSANAQVRLADGLRISREWRGCRYDVVTEGDGYLYEGRRYRNLSQIAREITGVRWNGPRFFGLRPGDAA